MEEWKVGRLVFPHPSVLPSFHPKVSTHFSGNLKHAHSTTVSPAWVRQANQEYQRVLRQKEGANTKPGIDET